MSVVMALAEARHHTAPRGLKTARAEATYDALRSQRTSVAGDTEFFSLYEEELGGTRLDRLAGYSGTPRSTLSASCPPCRLSMLLCRRWGRSCWTS